MYCNCGTTNPSYPPEAPEYLLMCKQTHAETFQEIHEVMHFTVLAIKIAAMLSSLPENIFAKLCIRLWCIHYSDRMCTWHSKSCSASLPL